MNANIPNEFNNFFLKDVSFVNLMTKRIFNILIVANPYDAFMLEDDGRIDEKLFDEYSELGMRYPPSFTQVSTTEEADNVLKTTDIDLVICMPGNADTKAKKETLREENVYRYDVSISGKNVSLWYNSEALVQLYVAFENDGGETEEYTIALSDYIFDQDLPEEAFKRPSTYGITYIQSPISFEDWTNILTSFAQKLG